VIAAFRRWFECKSAAERDAIESTVLWLAILAIATVGYWRVFVPGSFQ
jgi:hypothetical protein